MKYKEYISSSCATLNDLSFPLIQKVIFEKCKKKKKKKKKKIVISHNLIVLYIIERTTTTCGYLQIYLTYVIN
jgi:hypothetical protein